MTHDTAKLVLPTAIESKVAGEARRAIAARMTGEDRLSLQMAGGGKGSRVDLPAPAVRLLLRILDEMSRGNAVALVPVEAELTTQEAATVLQISRPSLIELLDAGKVAYRRVGTHRRVGFASLMAYKRQADAERRAVLAELAAYDQELGL
jgi:excisionase family DNA binding protein